MQTLKKETSNTLTNNILPYWVKLTDTQHGGFYGQVTGNEQLIPTADKAAIQHTRILWTFSAAYRILHKKEYLRTATHAKNHLIQHLYDHQNGGIYWTLTYNNQPRETKKQTYALSFAIYGLSEYHRATGDPEALQYAIQLFHDIEQHTFDQQKNGYCEALTQQWGKINDMRLSPKDMNRPKTMNTHLHILEAYTNLHRVWKNQHLHTQLRNLINLFTEKIINPETGHLGLYFDNNWNSRDTTISYGHDIEASWLLHEAVIELNDPQLLRTIHPIIHQTGTAATEGYLPGAGMIYEINPTTGHIDADRHWWVQAEAIVGFINLYQHFIDPTYLIHATDCWQFIKNHLIDHKNGEWLWSILTNGTPNHTNDKAGPWKCPYHNSRMCLELIERTE